MGSRFACAAALLICAASVAAAESSAGTPRLMAPSAQSLERGRWIYTTHCAACHGVRGNGQGETRRFLRLPARDFTSAVYKFRSTPSGELPTDADLVRTVRRGIPGTDMPSWAGRLPGGDIDAVVQFIKTFSSRFSEEGITRVFPPADPPGDLGDPRVIGRGRLVYVLQRCWSCHGMGGKGDGPAAPGLLDDNGQPIQAYDFTRGRFGSGGRPSDVFRTFTTGVNGTPMPSYDEALMVGRDGFADLTEIRTALGDAITAEVTTSLSEMPTTEEILAWPEDERRRWTERTRWDLVAYVLSLRRARGVVDELFSPMYISR